MSTLHCSLLLSLSRQTDRKTDRQFTQAMRRDIPPTVWKSPTITMYKKIRTPGEIKKKQKNPNIVARTQSNTPAKSKTKQKKQTCGKYTPDVECFFLMWRSRISYRFWFFCLFLIWPAYLHGFSQPCLVFFSVFGFPQVL